MNELPSARARWLGLVLILLALAVLTWQAYLAGQPESAAPPPAGVAGLPQGPLSLGEMLSTVDSAKLGMQAASAAALAAASVSVASDEVDVCGMGRVKADAAGRPKNMEPIRLAGQRAREQLLPLLANSPDEATRAAGLLLQSVGERAGAGDAAERLNAPARDALANMAVATRSPQVYAMAMRACQGQRGEGMCQLLSAEQWARLEPGNAFAWLHVAADSQARKDNAGVAEAMYRVSLATHSDTRWGARAAIAMAKLPADVTVLARGALVTQLAEIDGGADLPLVVASQYCSAAEVRDANRQQVCSAVAEVLNTRGRTLIESALGAVIGQRVGWPAERLAAGRDERDAIAEMAAQSEAPGRWGCVALTSELALVTDIGQHGELAAMRRILKQSPEGVAALARRHREAAARRTADAASGPASGALQ